MSTALVLPVGAPDLLGPEPGGPALPVAPEPVTDGGGDRLVVVARPLGSDRPSATLLAAQQLSDEADRDPYRPRGGDTPRAARRRRRQRALVADRRAHLTPGRPGPTAD